MIDVPPVGPQNPSGMTEAEVLAVANLVELSIIALAGRIRGHERDRIENALRLAAMAGRMPGQHDQYVRLLECSLQFLAGMLVHVVARPDSTEAREASEKVLADYHRE